MPVCTLDERGLSDDLSQVVRHVQPRATPEGTWERVNSEEVRAYLEAGVDALIDVIQSGSAERGRWQGLFRQLGKKRIEPAARIRLGRRSSSESLWQFEYFWRHQVDYHLDLVAYILRPAWYEGMIDTLKRRVIGGDLAGLPFGTLAERVCAEQERLQRSEPMIAVAYLVQTTLSEHPVAKELMAARYRDAVTLWAEFYELIFERYGLTLRPGRSFRDFAALLNAFADGVIMRGTVAADLTVLSDGESLFMRSIRLLLADAIGTTADLRDVFTLTPRA